MVVPREVEQCEVGRDGPHAVGTGAGGEQGRHRRAALDAVDHDAARGERDGEAAGAHPEFEDGAVAAAAATAATAASEANRSPTMRS